MNAGNIHAKSFIGVATDINIKLRETIMATRNTP